MVDTLDLPTTCIFLHIVLQIFSGLNYNMLRLDPTSKTRCTKAVIENPAIADWFFTHRIQKFIDAYYIGALGATDYWLRFEWQHRGSLNVHGLTWLPNPPNVEHMSHADNTIKDEIIHYQHADRMVCMINPGVFSDGSDIENAPTARRDPHIKAYNEVTGDLIELVAACQRHDRCS